MSEPNNVMNLSPRLHWKKSLIRAEFLKLYFDYMGVSNLINIRRLIDLFNFDKSYNDEQLLFAIVRINDDSQYYSDIDLENKTSEVKVLLKDSGIKILQPIKQNEEIFNKSFVEDKTNETNEKQLNIKKENRNDSSFDFLTLAYIGFLNQKNPKLINGTISDFFQRFNEEYEKLDNKLDFQKLTKIFESDQKLNEKHNKIITNIFQNDLEQIHLENNEKYSLFFGFEGQLIEYIQSKNILRIIEKDGITESNIGEKIYKFISSVNNRDSKDLFYLDDITLFCENKEKSNEEVISSNMSVFFIVLVSTILFLINFLIFMPQKIFYLQRDNLYNYFKYDDLDLLYSKDLVINYIEQNFFIQIINKSANSYGFNLSSSKVNDDKDSPNDLNYYYIMNSNIFCGMSLNFKIGKKDESSQKLYKTSSGYYGQKPKIDKEQEFYFPSDEDSLELETYQEYISPKVTNSKEVITTFEDIMSKSITELYINLMLYNNDYEMTLTERVKFKFDTIGKIQISRNFEGTKIFLNKGKIAITLLILNIFYLLSVVYDTFRVIRLFTSHIINFFKYRINTFEISDFIDLITSILVIVSIIWFYSSILWRSSVFPIICNDETDFVKWVKIIRNIKNYRNYTSICMFLLFVKLLIFFYRSFPALGIVFDTLSKAFIELFSLFFLIFIILIGFFFMFHGIFGGYTHSYYSFSQAFLSVYMLFMGIFYYKFDFEYIGESAFITAYLISVFFIVFNIILCNVFLCLIISTFEEVKEKKQMHNDAVFMMTIESALNLYEKIKNLLLCSEPDYVIQKQEKKRKEGDERDKDKGKDKDKDKEKEKEKEKEKPVEDTGVELMSKMANKNYYKIIKYNLSNLDCLDFFKKNLIDLEDFEKKKENNFKIIRKNILKEYVEELKLDTKRYFETLTDAILYILFISMSIYMLYIQLRLQNRDKIQYYAYSHVLEKYFPDFENDSVSLEQIKDYPKNFFKQIYDCDTGKGLNLEIIPGYTFFKSNSSFSEQVIFRLTSRLYYFVNNDKGHEKQYYPIKTKSGSGFLDDKSCPHKFEYVEDIVDSSSKYSLIYHKSGDNYTINSCGGYSFFIGDTCPFLDMDSDFVKFINIMENKNYGRITLDFFLVSENYDYILYFVVNLLIHPSGAKKKRLYANIIPVNRFITINDFNILVVTIVCYVLYFYFFFKILYAIWLLIKEEMMNSYRRSGDSETFKDSPLINKFYQFDVSSYKNDKGCLLVLKIIFFTIINFIWKTLILIWFIIMSIIRFMTDNMFNFLDLFSSGVSLGMFCLYFHIINVTNSLDLNQIYSKRTGEYDYNLFKVNHLYKLYARYYNWNAINLFLLFVRLIQYLKFSKSIYLVFAIFQTQKLTIILYLIFLFIINLGFVFFGYGLFSQELKTFHTIGSGLLDVFVILAGKIRTYDVSNIDNETFNPVFLFLFTTINYLVLLNFFYSILIEGYSEVKSRQVKNLGKDSTNYNILATIVKINKEKMKLFKNVCENYQKKLISDMMEYKKSFEQYEEDMEPNSEKKKIGFVAKLDLKNQINNNFLTKIDKTIRNNNEDITIYTKIIVYIRYILSTNFEVQHKKEELQNKDKLNHKVDSFEIEELKENEEKVDYKEIKWKSGFLTTYKRYFKDKNSVFFKSNLFDKYYYYNDPKISMYYLDRRDKPDLEKFNKHRIPRFSKECFLDQLESLQLKDFFMIPSVLSKYNKDFNDVLPCISNTECYLKEKRCEKCKKNQKQFNKLAGEIYDIIIKYFYLPENDRDLDIYVGYFIHSKKESKSIIDFNNLSKSFTEDHINQFWKEIVSKIHKPFELNFENKEENLNEIGIEDLNKKKEENSNEENKVNEENKENEENKKENIKKKISNNPNNNNQNNTNQPVKLNQEAYKLYYKYFIWSILYKVFINKDKKFMRKIRNFSKSYQIHLEHGKNLLSKNNNKENENEEEEEIETKSNEMSLFFKIFFTLYDIEKENWENVILEYDLPKNSLPINILEHIFLNEKINQNEISIEKEKFEKATLFYFDSKYQLGENERIKDYLLKEKTQFIYDDILKFETYPIIFTKIWSRISSEKNKKGKLDELRNLFLGYNQLVDEKLEEKIDFLHEIKQKDFLKKFSEKLDVYKFLSPEERAEFTLMYSPDPEFVNSAISALMDKYKESTEKKQKIEKIKSFQDLLKYFKDERINIIEKHKIFFKSFEMNFNDIKDKLSDINQKYIIAYHKFLRRRNDELEPINKIILSQFYTHLIEKERFDILKNILKTKFKIKKSNIEEEKKLIASHPIFEPINKNDYKSVQEIEIKTEQNIIKNPFLWMLSLTTYNYFDTCQKIKDDDVKEFYLELYNFIYGEEDDKEAYYLKRKVKLNFIEKYDKYLEYCKIRERIEKKKDTLMHLEKELEEGINYLDKRQKQYNNLFQKWQEQKNILEDELGNGENQGDDENNEIHT